MFIYFILILSESSCDYCKNIHKYYIILFLPFNAGSLAMTRFVDETVTIMSKVSPLEIEPVTGSGFLGGSYSDEYDKVLEHHHRKHHDLRLPLFLPRTGSNYLL